MLSLAFQIFVGNLLIFINQGFNINTFKSFKNILFGSNTLLIAAIIYLLFLPFLRELI